jgi:hypothetical protein
MAGAVEALGFLERLVQVVVGGAGVAQPAEQAGVAGEEKRGGGIAGGGQAAVGVDRFGEPAAGGVAVAGG